MHSGDVGQPVELQGELHGHRVAAQVDHRAVCFTQTGGAKDCLQSVSANTSATVNGGSGGIVVPAGHTVHGGTNVSPLDPTGLVLLNGSVTSGGCIGVTGT